MGHMSREVKCNDVLGNVVVDDEKCTADSKPTAGKWCYMEMATTADCYGSTCHGVR